MFFKDYQEFRTEIGGRPLVVEVGKMAQLAGGACLVRYGETNVLCTATMSAKPREGIDFFPLSVDFEEKLYAVGKIPGSFQRREGRASEKAVLASRVIDRPIRPLFPKDMRNDVSVVATVMSVDQDCPPDMVGMLGVSIALSVSEIPWRGPVSGVTVGLVDGEYIINPTAAQREKSLCSVVVASTAELVAMIEAGASEVSNQEMYEAILFGHAENQKLVAFVESIVAAVGKSKIDFPSNDPPQTLFAAVEALCAADIKVALDTDDKRVRDERLKPIYAAAHEKFDAEADPAKIDDCLYKVQKKTVRAWLLEGKRVDGRGMDEIRPLHAEIDLLDRAHGSGMFTRGQTQVLTVTTLGGVRMEQNLDGIDEEESKRYIHHYNFPSFSVGETKPARGPGRREIGHGALAERALLPVIPGVEDFPYAIRLVSEVLSSNGSTSQGAVCASTLSLMAAGVPIKAPVAGISCGLITQGEKFATMVDIQGLEDFFGDMDFKVAGTRKGITAIQMDLKIDGLTPAMIQEALDKTYAARLKILDEVMLPVIAAPREELSKYAPKMLTLTIPADKIGDVVGKQGVVIKKIQELCNCKIDIEEKDGKGFVFVASADTADGQRAVDMINTIANDPQVGDIFNGVVTRLMDFGAFVEIAPGKEGLVHISHLDVKRTERVEDAVAVGDSVMVKVRAYDDQGRLNLSRREALIEVQGLTAENTVSDAPRRPARPPRR
jgi:polyribonucleotide nucleotidyltransferase